MVPMFPSLAGDNRFKGRWGRNPCPQHMEQYPTIWITTRLGSFNASGYRAPHVPVLYSLRLHSITQATQQTAKLLTSTSKYKPNSPWLELTGCRCRCRCWCRSGVGVCVGVIPLPGIRAVSVLFRLIPMIRLPRTTEILLPTLTWGECDIDGSRIYLNCHRL